jgi:flagellar biosynthesis protein FlhG
VSPVAALATHFVVVVAAQGTAITHAYALIKRVFQEHNRETFQIAVTRARSPEEARAIFDNMRRVAREHLGVRLDYLGASAVPVTDHLADALLRSLPPAVEIAEMGGFLPPAAGVSRRPSIPDSVL